MTDRIALWLGLLLAALILLALAGTGGGTLLFLARRLSALVEYLIVWR